MKNTLLWLAKKNVTLQELEGTTLIHCTSQKLEVTPSDLIFESVKDSMQHIHCNSLKLLGVMICDGVGVGPIIRRALSRAFLEGDLDKNRITSVSIEGTPSLRSACVFHKNSPEYLRKIVQEIVQM